MRHVVTRLYQERPHCAAADFNLIGKVMSCNLAIYVCLIGETDIPEVVSPESSSWFTNVEDL